MKFNIVQNSSGPRSPMGGTDNQTVAGLNGVSVYLSQVAFIPQAAPAGNTDAASVIQSNGELIGNPVIKSNPLPPGITS